MRRSVLFLAAAALLTFVPGGAGAGEGHGWRGEGDRYSHGRPMPRYGHHRRRHRHHHHAHLMDGPEPPYGHGGPVLVELRDPYLPVGVLYNVPGPPPAYVHSTVIRAKY